jgi:hypothetical protein
LYHVKRRIKHGQFFAKIWNIGAGSFAAFLAGIAADRAMDTDLEISQQNVRLGERLVMDQLGRIGKMERRGYDTKQALEFLAVLANSLNIGKDRIDFILEELGRERPNSAG